MADALLTEIADAGKAIGLLKPDGGLKPEWFADPLGNLESILSDSDQRAAFLDLLDQIVPPASVPGIAPNEKWHLLVGKAGAGNLYLTASANGVVKFGLAADLTGGGATNASLRAHLPVVSFSGNTLTAIAGTNDGPLDVTLRVELNLAHSATSIGLKAISAVISLKPVVPAFDMQIMLEGLDL